MVSWGPFKCYVTQMGVGCQIFRKKRYEGVRFNVICVRPYEGVGGGSISRQKRYVTLVWPLSNTFSKRTGVRRLALILEKAIAKYQANEFVVCVVRSSMTFWSHLVGRGPISHRVLVNIQTKRMHEYMVGGEWYLFQNMGKMFTLPLGRWVFNKLRNSWFKCSWKPEKC